MARNVKSYEGSLADLAEDKRGAKVKGVSLKAYERTARDKAEDRKGQLARQRRIK